MSKKNAPAIPLSEEDQFRKDLMVKGVPGAEIDKRWEALKGKPFPAEQPKGLAKLSEGRKPRVREEIEDTRSINVDVLLAKWHEARQDEIQSVDEGFAKAAGEQLRRENARLAVEAHNQAMRLSPEFQAWNAEAERLKKVLEATVKLMPGVKLGFAPQGSAAQKEYKAAKAALGAEKEALGAIVAEAYGFASAREFYDLLNNESDLLDKSSKKEG